MEKKSNLSDELLFLKNEIDILKHEIASLKKKEVLLDDDSSFSNLEKTTLHEEEEYPFFKNPLYVVSITTIWWLITVFVFWVIGLLDSSFFNFGPRDTLLFFKVPITTWSQWFMVSLFTFIEQAIWCWAEEIVLPWKINTVQDHKTIFIRRKRYYYYHIVGSFEILQTIRFALTVWVWMSQVDILIVSVAGDLLSNLITTWIYIKNKKNINQHKDFGYKAIELK